MKIKKLCKKSISIILTILIIVSTMMFAVTSASAWSTGSSNAYYIYNNVTKNGWSTGSPKMTWDSSKNYYYDFYLKQNEVTDEGLRFRFYSDNDSAQIGPSDWESTHVHSITTTGSKAANYNDWGDKETCWGISTSSLTSGYYYRLRVYFQPSGGDGAGWAYYDQTRKSNMSPKVTASSNSITLGSSVTLTPSITSDSNVGTVTYKYEYSTNGGSSYTTITSSTNSSYTWTPSSIGTYTVRVTATDGGVVVGTNACTARTETSSTTTVTVNPSTYSITNSYDSSKGSVSISPTTAASGTTVTVTATPNSGYAVSSITAKYTSSSTTVPVTVNGNKGTFTMPAANVTVTTEFSQSQYTVSASVSGGGGTVTPATQTIDAGGNASITITPDSGYELASITDNGSPVTSLPTLSNGKYTYTISNVAAAHTVVVTFKKITHTVTINTTGNGTATINGKTSDSVAEGEDYNVVVAPADGYEVSSFKVDGTETTMDREGGTYTGTMDKANVTIDVVFTEIPATMYSLDIGITDSSTNGTVTYNNRTVTGDQTITGAVRERSSFTITIEPARNYKVTAIRLNESPVDLTALVGKAKDVCSYTVENVSTDCKIRVEFGPMTTADYDHYTVTIGKTVRGGKLTAKYAGQDITEGSKVTVREDDFITLSATPSENYSFIRYEDENGNDITSQVVAGQFYPTKSITIYAVFSASGMELNDVEIWVKGTTMSTYAIKCQFEGQNMTVEQGDYIGTYVTGAYRFYWYKIKVGTIRVGASYSLKLTTAKSRMNATGTIRFENCDEDHKIAYLAVDDMVDGKTFVDITKNEAAKASFRSVQNMISNEKSTDLIDTPPAKANVSVANADGSVSVETYMLGDVDYNDTINVKDATKIQLYIAGLSSDNENMNILGDFDISGDVNIKDATKIQLKIAGFNY